MSKEEDQYLLVARKKVDKGMVEYCFDFVGTLGNQRYIETYFQIKRDSSINSCKIVERQYVNEKNAADIRNIFSGFQEEFDFKQQTLLKIELYKLGQNENNTSEQFLSQVKELLSNKKYSDLNKQYNLYSQFAKAFSCGAMAGRQTVVEFYKILNNAIWKKGLDQLITIGGKKMMQEGAIIVMKKGGKRIGEATVKEVIKKGGKKKLLAVSTTSFSVASAAKGVGLSLGINLAIGTAKSYLMSGWNQDEVNVDITIPLDFKFQLIQNIEELIKPDESTLQALMENEMSIENETEGREEEEEKKCIEEEGKEEEDLSTLKKEGLELKKDNNQTDKSEGLTPNVDENQQQARTQLLEFVKYSQQDDDDDSDVDDQSTQLTEITYQDDALKNCCSSISLNEQNTELTNNTQQEIENKTQESMKTRFIQTFFNLMSFSNRKNQQSEAAKI